MIKCAKHAAANRGNSDITPEEVASSKGSPYNLILSQFQRAFGCLAMRAAADEKLRKTMLIRSSRFKQHTIPRVIIEASLIQGCQDGMTILEMKLFMTHSIDIAPPTIIFRTKVTQYRKYDTVIYSAHRRTNILVKITITHT